jgi:hypothetical protein
MHDFGEELHQEPEPTKAAQRSWPIAAALGFFMVPHLVFAVSWGNFELYRASQVFWLALLTLTFFPYLNLLKRSSSTVAIVIVAVLAFSIAGTIIADLYGGADLDVELLTKALFFMVTIFLMDRVRFIGFDSFAAFARPVAIVTIIATAVHFAVNPEILYERYTFFGMHPNLGGEVLFACAIFIAFSSSFTVRVVFGLLICALLLLLQSRAALVGTVLVIAIGEFIRMTWYGSAQARRQKWMFLFTASGAALLGTVVLAPSTLESGISLVSSQILLIDDPDRGVGTGMVGRDVTWQHAMSLFRGNPFFGVGLDRAAPDEEMDIHSGYLSLLAEFGLLSIPLLLVMLLGLRHAMRQRSLRVAVIVACMFVFIFNARSINLNAFPLILWIACLPWADTRPQTGRIGLGKPG